MAFLATRTRVRKSLPQLPLFEWADRRAGSDPYVTGWTRLVQRRAQCSPALAKAMCEAWQVGGRYNG